MENVKKIFKRNFSGSDKHNIIHSEYMKSYKYAVVALIQPTETHYGGISTSTFRTKKEAEESQPKYANQTFEKFQDAEEHFNQYCK